VGLKETSYDERVLANFVDAGGSLLVDEELMQRRRGIYWRTGSVPNVGHDPVSWPSQP